MGIVLLAKVRGAWNAPVHEDAWVRRPNTRHVCPWIVAYCAHAMGKVRPLFAHTLSAHPGIEQSRRGSAAGHYIIRHRTADFPGLHVGRLLARFPFLRQLRALGRGRVGGE